MRIEIRKGDDMHVHWREGKVLDSVMGFTAQQFKRAVVMPNTNPPILTAIDIDMYRQDIYSWGIGGPEPLLTIQLTDNTTPQMIVEAKKSGAVAGKVYPLGVTTNSQNGVKDFTKIFPALEEMQRQGMLLLLHGESPGVFCLDRESNFIEEILFDLSRRFPNLKIVLEHITTNEAVCTVCELDNVAATITAHHLLLTLDDVVGNMLEPHNFCKPLAKRPEDRKTLLAAATHGNPKFFFGSDSAPHLREKKECSHGCAGVFSAPVAMPLLAQIFEEQGCLDHLENFTSKFGADFYGLPQNTSTITLVKEDWIVPAEFDGIVPFMAGQTLHWKVV